MEIPERHGKRVNNILDVCFFKIGILMDLEIDYRTDSWKYTCCCSNDLDALSNSTVFILF